MAAWGSLPLPTCLVFPQLETSARFLFGQPGRDTDLSPGDVAQPCAGSQLPSSKPTTQPGWAVE